MVYRFHFGLIARLGFALMLGLSMLAEAATDEAELLARLRSGGHVLLIRHALAPGVGDPAGFRIDDCTTQRNLDEQGRAQARAIGQWLRSRRIEHARVYSSQWCRCLETARLMELGAVTALAPLNSFYERPDDREPNLRDLRRFLAEQPRDGPPLVLVTHQVIIQALTGQSAASGEGLLLELRPEGSPAVIGHMHFGAHAAREGG